MAFIEAKDVTKVYDLSGLQINALRGVTFEVEQGEFVAIMGPSGSGKSTLMNILGCLDTPTSGRYLLDGLDVDSFDRNQLAEIRSKRIGFVFQGFNLLPRTTALENVELPMLYDGVAAKERKKRAAEALNLVGLDGVYKHNPNQLSGGQQQRVTIARALVNHASLIIADEPTGNLDTASSMEIMNLLVKLNRESNITIILVTHEKDIADYSRRLIKFLDGRIVSDKRKPSP
jgi:putative ABC transport system ATP-binding protein